MPSSRPPKPPPRSPQPNAPPPPPRQPPPFTRNPFPPPPPPAGSRRSHVPPRNDTRSSWAQASAEDARAKTNDFKAWEQMRHGQGPVPSTGTAPRYSAKSAAFSPGRDHGGGRHTDSMPKRPNRDHLDDAYSHVPGVSTSHTTRTPTKAGFAPGTPGGDEPPARNSSAYFNVFRAERAATSRDGAHAPPPPKRPTAPAKRADPLQSFRNHAGVDEAYVNMARVSTPYATAGGEKTYFSSRPLGRSTSWKEDANPSNCYESEPTAAQDPHLRPSSVAPDRNRSSSPRMRSRSERRPPSPSTSSSSSSDESIRASTGEKLYGSTRPPTDRQRAKGRGRTEGLGKPNFQPSVDIDDAEDEDSARSGRSNVGYRWGNGSRRQPPDQYRSPNAAGGDHPEGFTPHGMQHEAKKDQPDLSPSHASKAYTPTTSTVPPRPLNKPRSWHNDNRSAQGVRQGENGVQPPVDRQDGQARMYETSSSSSSPSSAPWSDQWSFMSPKKLRHAAAALPPCWAILTSLFPKRRKVETHDEIGDRSRSEKVSQLSTSNPANRALPYSFTFPPDDPSTGSQHKPSLKSRSSESINVNFSPDWPSTFTGGTNEYFFSSSADPNGDADRKTSPSRTHAVPHPRPSSQHPQASNAREPPDQDTEMHWPPKDANVPPATSREEWAQHFRPAVFSYPLPPRSPGQKTMRKRLPTSRRAWKPSSSQFSAFPNPPKPFATVEDENEEGPDTSSVAESVSSKASGNESPMDIDPALTPPSATQSQVNGESSSPSGPAPTGTEATPRPAAPAVPPRPKSTHVEGSHLNLAGLKEVAPLAPTQEGLRNLTELHTALPFESRPSNQSVHFETVSSPPPPVALPHPPKAPFVPDKLTETAWERYLAHMRVYMVEWNVFNRAMLDHFNERQARVQEVLKPEWMSSVGEGSERWGYRKYMQNLDEDLHVRAHWDVSWEKHCECMKGLGGVRERYLGGKGGGRNSLVS